MYEIKRASLIGCASSGPFVAGMDLAITTWDPEITIRQNIGDWKGVWHTVICVGYYPEVRPTDPAMPCIDGEPMIYECVWPRSRVVPLWHLIQTNGPNYRVYEWLPEIAQDVCDRFLEEFAVYPYSPDAYLYTTLNRLTRGKFPRIAPRRLMCWESWAAFTMFCGRPIMHYYEQGYMPAMIERIVTGVMPPLVEGYPKAAAWFNHYQNVREAAMVKTWLKNIEEKESQ